MTEKALRFMWAHPEVDEWWAHFAHAFDTLHLVAAAYRLNWRVRAAMAGQGPVGVDISPSGTTRWLAIRDLYRVLDSKLKDIAEKFQLPSRKLFSKADYSQDMRDLPREHLKAGCVTDALLVVEALDTVEALLKGFGGELKATFSASALSVLNAHLKAEGTKLPKMEHARSCPRDRARATKQGPAHKSAPKAARPGVQSRAPGTGRTPPTGSKVQECACYFSANILAKHGYYGARVEVIHHRPGPKAPLTRYDVSSMYPWAMRQTLPIRWAGNVSHRIARKAYAEGVHGVYQATVTVSKGMHLPPLPYRPAEEGGLFFPTGTWRAWFAAIELKYAESLGCRVRVHQGVTYESGAPFASYIDQLYEVKRTAAGAKRELMKKLLVGSYGKFAEKPERETLLFIPDLLEALHYQWSNAGVRPLDPELDPRILGKEELRYAKHAHYAIGAYITAYARIRLREYARETTGLAYMDTDSLDCESWPGETGDALGQLKVELSHFEGRYRAAKLYSLHDPATGAYLINPATGNVRAACKGFLKGTGEDYESIVHSGETFHALILAGAPRALAKEGAQGVGQALTRTRLLRSHLKPGASDMDSVLRLRVYKSWSGLSGKRKPFPDGSTRAWSVGELKAGKHLSAESPWV